MAEVLAGLGALFSSGAGAGAASTVGASAPMSGVGLLQPDILVQAKDVVANPQGFTPGMGIGKSSPSLLEALKTSGQSFSAYKQANPSEQLKMMQLQQPGQFATIQQQDLMTILKNLGGY